MGRRLADFIVNKSEDELYEDSRSLVLTHYVMAERCMQAEYDRIRGEIANEPSSDTLIYMLEGGFSGFHNMEPSTLIREYEDCEERWYNLYETDSLPWGVLEEDPVVALEDDANGEVETYGKRLTDAEVQDA